MKQDLGQKLFLKRKSLAATRTPAIRFGALGESKHALVRFTKAFSFDSALIIINCVTWS